MLRGMTYRQLMEEISRMTDEQKDAQVTVEDSFEEECYSAELRICGPEHQTLDDGYPVIYF